MSTINNQASIFKNLLIPNIITVDASSLAKGLQTMIKSSSSRGLITTNDLLCLVTDVDAAEAATEVVELLKLGMRLFDAIFYLSTAKDLRPKFQTLIEGKRIVPFDIGKTSKLLYCLAFHLLTRANIPIGDTTEVEGQTPKFLKTVLGYDFTGKQICEDLASFSLANMEHTWIKFINWSDLAAISKNRFALGVAGYRMLAPFKLFEVQSGATEQVKAACAVAKAWANMEYSWNFHPITKDVRLIAATGSLNANLGNLILLAFSASDIQIMLADKVIFAKPIEKATARQWKSWTSETYKIDNNHIFINN